MLASDTTWQIRLIEPPQRIGLSRAGAWAALIGLGGWKAPVEIDPVHLLGIWVAPLLTVLVGAAWRHWKLRHWGHGVYALVDASMRRRYGGYTGPGDDGLPRWDGRLIEHGRTGKLDLAGGELTMVPVTAFRSAGRAKRYERRYTLCLSEAGCLPWNRQNRRFRDRSEQRAIGWLLLRLATYGFFIPSQSLRGRLR